MTPSEEYRRNEERDDIVSYFSGLPPERQIEEMLELLDRAFQRASKTDLDTLKKRIVAQSTRLNSNLVQQVLDLIDGQLAIRHLTMPSE